MISAEVFLRPDRERSVRNRHPWIYAGAIRKVAGDPSDGDVVQVVSASGEPLARGVVNRRSQISVRLLSWDLEETIDDGFWRGRLERAVKAREPLRRRPGLDAYRLVHGEADGLPGLVVDRYGGWLSVQLLSAAVERRRDLLLDLLVETCAPHGIVDRSDEAIRRLEGLPSVGGTARGEAPPDVVEIVENGRRFRVDLLSGQKTGFYLDQRENRRRIAPFMKDAEVLDAFCYSGSFAVHAAAAGARSLTLLDSSPDALRLAGENLALNGVLDVDTEFVEGNAFEVLRAFRDAGRSFDAVIVDPPKFAHGKSQVERALRGYKDINLLAMKLVRPGGWLVTFSCSGVVTPDVFQRMLFQASADAGRDGQIMLRLDQGTDHPVLLTFPESHYLKGAVVRVP